MKYMCCLQLRTMLGVMVVALSFSPTLPHRAAQISQELTNDIIRSIAIKGCDVFVGNAMRKSSELRDCFASTQENPQTASLIRSTDLDLIREATGIAITRIQDIYHVQENFEWVLVHEGELRRVENWARQGKFDEIRRVYKTRQDHNENARNLLSSLSDNDIYDLIRRTPNGELGTQSQIHTEVPTALVDYVSQAVSRGGCEVFRQEAFKSADELRECYLSVERHNHNGEALDIVRAASPEAITSATTRAVFKIKEQYHVQDAFEWYLSHSGLLDRVRSMVQIGAFTEIRKGFANSRKPKSDAPYLLNALADSEIAAIADLQRFVILIPQDAPAQALASLSDLLYTQTVDVTSRTTAESLNKLVCVDIMIIRACHEIASHAYQSQGLHVTKSGVVSGANTVQLPVLPPVGVPTEVTFRPGVSRETVAARLASNGVPYEEPKHVALIQPEQNVALASETVAKYADNGRSWFVYAIAADKIRNKDLNLIGSVHVGIIDAGVDVGHQVLQPFFWKLPITFPNNKWTKGSIGFDYLRELPDPTEELIQESHGTHITGLVTARPFTLWLDEFKTMKLADHLQVYSLKIAGQNGIPDFSFPAQALYESIPDEIHLFNVSLSGPQSGLVRDYLKAHSQQALIVLAAGNDGIDMNADLRANGTFREDGNGKPLANVIIVAALTDNGKLTPKSNHGNVAVEIAAPGDNIYSTVRGGTFDSMTGTSQAAPLVTATAALLLSEQQSAYPSQIKERILSTCDWDAAISDAVAEGCKLNMAKAIVAKTDVVELRPSDGSNSTQWLYGSVDASHLQLKDEAGNVIDPSTLHRIWFTDQNGQVQIAIRGGGHKAARLSPGKVGIQLDDGQQCPGTANTQCEVDTTKIRDIVFRWQG